MTTINFQLVSHISGSKILNSQIKSEGATIMEAVCRLREKLGASVTVEKTEVKRVLYTNGGFRVITSVSPRLLKKYTDDKGTVLAPLHLTVN